MHKRTIHFVLTSILAIGSLLALVWLSYVFGLIGSSLSGEKSFDFGVVPIERPSSSFEHIFRLTNVTDKPLQLEDAVSTCGCTTTDLPDYVIQPGQEMLVPVLLKLQKSQYRSSKVRLVFKSGEVVVLSIEGTGRFTQPLQCMPPNLSVSKGDAQGTRCLLSLEWFKVSNPPLPIFVLPADVRVETAKWVLSKEGDAALGIPDIWTLQLHVFLDGTLPQGSMLTIEFENAPSLLVPLKQVESNRRPSFL